MARRVRKPDLPAMRPLSLRRRVRMPRRTGTRPRRHRRRAFQGAKPGARVDSAAGEREGVSGPKPAGLGGEISDLVKRYMQPNGVLCVDAAEFIALMERLGTPGELAPAIRSMIRTPAGGRSCLC